MPPYQPNTEDELFAVEEDALHTEKEGAPTSTGSMNRALLLAVARMAASNQEQALSRLYDVAFIQDASADDLSKKAREFGIIRRDAVPASGVVRFIRDSPTTSNHIIQSGTVVQTNGEEPISFETSETVTLPLYDNFESGSLSSAYDGDTGSGTVVDTTVNSGSFSLKLAATDGVEIYRDDVTTERGMRLHTAINPNGGTAQYRFVRQDASNTYQLSLDAASGTVSLEAIDGGVTNTLDSASVSLNSTYHDVTIDWSLDGEFDVTVEDGETVVVNLFSEEYVGFNFRSGHIGFRSGDGTVPKYFDDVSSSAKPANITAENGGTQTNVGRNSIKVMPSSPTGIDGVENPLPTGNNSYTDTSGREFQVGKDREGDTALRERVLESSAAGGAAAAGPVGQAVGNLDEVISTTLLTNPRDSSNDGLDPFSSEVVVYGGRTADIAQALYETMSAVDLLRLQGGVHGTKDTYTIYSGELDQEITIPITRPTQLDVDITVDVVHDATYAGADTIRDAIVSYIGGVNSSGATVTGISLGDDIVVDELDTAINNVTGVVATTNLRIDIDGDGTDDTTTDSDGVQVLPVASSEVVISDATDSSIVVNETER